MRTLAVIGALVRDRIEGLNGGVLRAWGGIAYAVEAAAVVASGRLRVLPVCRVAAAERSALVARWQRLPGIVLDGLVPWSGGQTSVYLHYGTPAGGGARADRQERLQHPQPPLRRSHLAVAAGADAVLLNCISGFDVTRAGARMLARSGGWLYLDLHSLLLGRGRQGERFPRRPLDLEAWLALADVVQCNRSELAVAAGIPVERRTGSVAGRRARPAARPPWRAAERQVAALRGAGVRLLLVTDGARGASLYAGDREAVALPASPVPVLDPTGAGDTFGAAFCVARLLGAGVPRAARYAVAVASAACAERGPGRLGAFPGFV